MYELKGELVHAERVCLDVFAHVRVLRAVTQRLACGGVYSSIRIHVTHIRTRARTRTLAGYVLSWIVACVVCVRHRRRRHRRHRRRTPFGIFLKCMKGCTRFNSASKTTTGCWL